MLKHISAKLRKNPLGLIQRAVYKTIVGPLKYGRANGYDAHKYWQDRFSKYGQSIKAVGNEALSEEANEKMYTEAAQVFSALCRKSGIALQSAKVLEIGCGAGFYTQLLHHFGVKNYVGVDITDVFFPQLRRNFPQFTFLRKDITADQVVGEFNLIVMIDVIQHIVTEERLSVAMENVRNCLSGNGLFIVSPIERSSRRYFFYLRSWSMEDLKQRFPGYLFSEQVPFRDSHLLRIRRP